MVTRITITFIAAGCALAASLLAGDVTRAQQNPKKDQCTSEDAPSDEVISVCTEVIRSKDTSKRDLAVAFQSRGKAYHQKSNYDQAILDYNEALRLNPNFKEALVSRGEAYERKQDQSRAFNDYNQAINLDPTFGPAFLGRATVRQNVGYFESAIDDYTKAINFGLPWKGGALSARALANRRMGNLDAAIADYSESLRLTSGDASFIVLRDRAETYLLGGEYDRAIADYTEAIKLYSFNDHPKGKGDLFLGRGNAYRNKGEYDNALADYAQAIKLESDLAATALERARAYAAKGDWDRAIADYSLSINKHGIRSIESCFIGRGNAYLAIKDYDRAIEDYSHAIDGFSLYSELAYYKRAAAYQAKGDAARAEADRSSAGRLNPYLATAFGYLKKVDYDDPITVFTYAIRLKPAEAHLWLGRGLIYRAMGIRSGTRDYNGVTDNSAAIADFSQAIKLDPEFAAAYANRGAVRRLMKHYEDAANDLTSAIRFDPKLSLAFKERGQLYHDKSDYARAIADFSRAIELDPKDANSFDRRGHAHFAKGEADRAVDDFTEVIRLEPKNFDAPYARAEVHFVSKNYDQAIADYTKAMELNPTLAGMGLQNLKKSGVHFGHSFARIFYKRGSAFFGKGDNHRAIADYTDAIELEREPLPIYLEGRAAAFRKLGNLDKAVTDYVSAANYYERSWNLRQAFATFDEILKFKPKLPLALNGRCWIRAIAGEQLDQALNDCNDALKVKREANTLDSRALVHLKRGNLKKSLADYDAAIKLDPKLASSLYGRGVVKLRLGDPKGANADMAAAAVLNKNVAASFVKYGVQ